VNSASSTAARLSSSAAGGSAAIHTLRASTHYRNYSTVVTAIAPQ
jgi:hypothetical protein